MRKPESGPQPAFIIGAPRSGTSWLQFMLGAHPSIVTPQELDLFSDYLPPLWNAWERELRRVPEDRLVGLSTVLTQSEFEEAMREFVAHVYGRLMLLKPGASVVLEKVPAYSHHVDLIDRLAPEARYVHLIRDGRDVVASMTSAARGWGHKWAPTNVRVAAAMWRDYVTAARRAREFDGRYIELRYEALLERGGDELMRAFEFLGVEASREACERIVDANAFERASASGELSPSVVFGGEALARFGRVAEPQGFFRAGCAGGWRTTLDERALRACEAVIGNLLYELGYETSRRVVSARRARLAEGRATLEHVARGAARRFGRRLQTWGVQ